MPSRTWIKIYCDKWLSGTIREESPLCRSVWVDLLTLAGSGRFGDTGVIQLSEGVGMTDAQIAAILHIPFEDWASTKERLHSTERISYNGNNIITILNWSKYQSEYERQRTYREKQTKVDTNPSNQKLLPKVTTKSYGEKEKEKEKRIDSIPTDIIDKPIAKEERSTNIASSTQEEKDTLLLCNSGKVLKKYPTSFIPLRREIFAGLSSRRGYQSRQIAAEAKSISEMLKEGFTPQQILQAYDLIKARPYFKDKNLSMMVVQKDLHEVLKNETGKGNNRQNGNPDKYSSGKYAGIVQRDPEVPEVQ